MSSNFLSIQPLPRFHSSFAKAHWAAQNLQSLILTLEAYSIHGVTKEVQKDSSNAVKEIRFRAHFFQHDVGLVVGDIVRNLRDSLDHFISGVFFGLDPEKRLVFPIAQDRQNLTGVIKSRFEGTPFEKIGIFIRDEIEPTKTENFPFWALNEINNADKHRKIAVVTAMQYSALPDYNVWVTQRYRSNWIRLEPGQSFDFKVPDNAEILDHNDLKGTLQITFGPSEVFSGEHVVPTLTACLKLYAHTLAKLHDTFIDMYGRI